MNITFQLKEKEDVIKLNKIATNYMFDIWVHTEDQMLDAKTLLALYTLPFNQDLRLVIEEGVNSKALLRDMEPFMK
ncbi:HPr family phosphocarrier protein [Radiobacillus sp. PE A8.2]|uniref:HPr family phosphocarrier protein n=1 Tax=Radiobacillus sp. PE A8.2 TaxID=3380349 RepID=UPI003890ADDF